MKFRPCIDIHNGRVKQIVGATLSDAEGAEANFIAEQDASFFAELYDRHGFSGGHIILLNPAGQPIYEKSRAQAMTVLNAFPGRWQIGGGITPANAADFLDAGATHVIVTSFVFHDGRIDTERLKKLVTAVGKEHLVLDLSCRRRNSSYYVTTDRWQHDTTTVVTEETLQRLSGSCDEFLVHGTDAEGKKAGIEVALCTRLARFSGCPVTYAGGIRGTPDIDLLEQIGDGSLDFTIGSALKIFGGDVELEELERYA